MVDVDEVWLDPQGVCGFRSKKEELVILVVRLRIILIPIF